MRQTVIVRANQRNSGTPEIKGVLILLVDHLDLQIAGVPCRATASLRTAGHGRAPAGSARG